MTERDNFCRICNPIYTHQFHATCRLFEQPHLINICQIYEKESEARLECYLVQTNCKILYIYWNCNYVCSSAMYVPHCGVNPGWLCNMILCSGRSMWHYNVWKWTCIISGINASLAKSLRGLGDPISVCHYYQDIIQTLMQHKIT